MVDLISAYKAWGLWGPVIYGSLQNGYAASSVECWGHWCVWCGVSGGFCFSPSRELSSWPHRWGKVSSTKHCLHVSHVPSPVSPQHIRSPLDRVAKAGSELLDLPLRCWGYRCELTLPVVWLEGDFSHSPHRQKSETKHLEMEIRRAVHSLEPGDQSISLLVFTLYPELHPQKL